MSVQDEINRIAAAKEDIISAIRSSGVFVPSRLKIEDIPPYIFAIASGGDSGTTANLGTAKLGTMRLGSGL